MIKRIRVCNFKSIVDITVELDPITVLIGKSGTGKTNFVEAIRFLRDVLVDPGQLHSGSRQLSSIKPIYSTDKSFRIEFDFGIDGIQESFRYEIEFDSNRPAVHSETLTHGESIIFDRYGSTWSTPPKENAEAPDPLPYLGRLPYNEQSVIAYVALTDGIGCYHFPSSVFQGESLHRPGQTGLADEGQHYLGLIADITKNLQNLWIRKSLLASLKCLKPTIAAVELNNLNNPTSVIVTHQLNGHALEVPLSQESDGFRMFYAHLLALYQIPSKQLLVFEEPENGIYPAALSLLADEMKICVSKGRGQVILTTHNPHLLDNFNVEHVRVVTIDKGQTHIDRIAAEQLSGILEGFMSTGDLLIVDPARPASEEAAVT